MIALKGSKTAQLYQCGMERDDAIAQGANAIEFDALVVKYKDGSIPQGDWAGFKSTPAYSCKYHTGGKQGETLRAFCKQA